MIKKQIEYRLQKPKEYQKHGANMNERDIRRICGTGAIAVDISNFSRTEVRNGKIQNIQVITNTYQKKTYVDYDVVICIPSNNRYEKVRRLISQFKTQPTKYTIKIVLLNDGSTDEKYGLLSTEFPDIIYIKNEKPNGKILHWYCYNQMWDYLRNVSCHAVLQMDDDFILCDDFLNIIVDLYFEKKFENNRVMAVAPHLWSFDKTSVYESWWTRVDFVDGISLIDDEVIKYMNYVMQPVDAVEVSKTGTPVRAWTQISAAIKQMNGIIHRIQYSLVYHDGNEDSRLHGDVRINGKGVFTQKYIGKL